jgi:hypothetical protein
VKTLVRLEWLFLLGLSAYLFAALDYAWWWYPLLFFAPDLGIIGYALGPRAGAVVYNLTHHLAVAAGAYVLGALLGSQPLQLAGLIVLGHSSLDRAMGYGLKYPDAFQHTHLGWIGRGAK